MTTMHQPNWQADEVVNIANFNLTLNPVNPKELQIVQALIQATQQQRDSSSHDNLLYRSLLTLNYTSQLQSFRASITSQTLAAFLINGKAMYGQRWLLNRLLKRYESSIQVVSVDLRGLGRRPSFTTLYRTISAKARIPADTVQQIANILCNWWKTQHTIIILHSVDRIGAPLLDEFLQNFWRSVVTVASKSPLYSGKYKLLMFLVDNIGVVPTWNITFAHKLDDSWNPEIPIRLPAITLISYKDLDAWINDPHNDLSDDFTVRTDAQTVLDNTDGIPESVLKELCALYDYDWEQGAAQWLKH
jgi:hypothetical protein